MVEHRITQTFTRSGESVSNVVTRSVGAEQFIDEAIPDESTDLQVALVLDVSQLKSLCIVSSQDVTLKTNNSGTPADTLALVAGEPIMWYSDSSLTCPLTVDVTALFVTNASGAEASLQIRAGYDPTV